MMHDNEQMIIYSQIGLKNLSEIDDEDEYDDEEDDEILSTSVDYLETSSSEVESCSVTPSIGKNYTIVLKYCHLPCGHPASPQSSLCLRTCSCPINHVLKAGECKPMTESTKKMINENSDKNIEHENSSPRDKRKYLSKKALKSNLSF